MGVNILIVDDSSVMRKILERSLRQAVPNGIDRVVEAGDGAEALAKLDSEGVHVVFSDINMPNVNGLEFLRRLRETAHKDLPVVMVTTEGGENAVRKAIALGAKGFIIKPFTKEQLEKAFTSVVG